jgi:Uncharacterized conserved protein, contains double-stranded beta-helix domain
MKPVRLASTKTGTKVQMFPGITRTTLCYDEASMLCHFHLEKGSSIPLHQHPAAQNGYVIRGEVRFLFEDGSSFVAGPGDGYLFEGGKLHGSEVLEDCELIECFTPLRPEYE